MEHINHNKNPIDIWAGVECTVVRVHDMIHDQLNINDHEKRLEDFDLFSKLNIQTIRYPILWEKSAVMPDFFSLHDERLKKLQELNITPIAGLLHHGSGPQFTSPLNPAFPQQLAEYASAIAERYPWIQYYTPVNEPLTTARFSGLYGIWYPHKQHDRAFIQIFLNEMKGIILSMQAIRKINPNAQLIQTEDICKVHSTKSLKYQADFENLRRWLTYDILTGQFNRSHPLWSYFLKWGATDDELSFFQHNEVIPAICGFNYYVTSERYLDHKKWLYPKRYHGGNGFDRYADIEAVRVMEVTPEGFHGLLKEAWERYKLPLALTEVHLACTREEQLRWFHDAYKAAERLREEGVDMRAVTAWSFLGSYDWDSLLTQKELHYEPGVFDLRSGIPRPTALAELIKSLKKNQSFSASLLKVPGWWKRDIRKETNLSKTVNISAELDRFKNISPLLIIGANGSLEKAFIRICNMRGIIYEIIGKNELDLTSHEEVEKVIFSKKPWSIINAAGFSQIDEAEKLPHVCFRENTLGPQVLAEICKEYGIPLMLFSTDQVFNGKKKKPYIVTDDTEPLNIYGESKRMAEEKVLAINDKTLIIRSGLFFNPWYKYDYLAGILQSSIKSDQSFYLPSDIIISPAYTPDLVNTSLDLLIDNESGIWHLSGEDEISYFEFAKLAISMAGYDEKTIIPVPSSKIKYAAERPSYSVLMSSGGISLPPIKKVLSSYLQEFFAEMIMPKVS